jgi:hypothetical protein
MSDTEKSDSKNISSRQINATELNVVNKSVPIQKTSPLRTSVVKRKILQQLEIFHKFSNLTQPQMIIHQLKTVLPLTQAQMHPLLILMLIKIRFK